MKLLKIRHGIMQFAETMESALRSCEASPDSWWSMLWGDWRKSPQFYHCRLREKVEELGGVIAKPHSPENMPLSTCAEVANIAMLLQLSLVFRTRDIVVDRASLCPRTREPHDGPAEGNLRTETKT